MATSRRRDRVCAKFTGYESAQAFVEFTLIAVLALVVLFAVIDLGRALNCMQEMIGLSRQGSNLASRGDTLSESAAAVVAGDAPLDLRRNGEVIVTSVANINSVNTITGQVCEPAACPAPSQGVASRSSKIGSGVGNPATVPAAATDMLQRGQTIYITEVFYSYRPITPIQGLLNLVMPSTLYTVAYF
jgi:Flp pilus assembly protein TadG